MRPTAEECDCAGSGGSEKTLEGDNGDGVDGDGDGDDGDDDGVDDGDDDDDDDEDDAWGNPVILVLIGRAEFNALQ